jgi:opacity protein-like surface antigen
MIAPDDERARLMRWVICAAIVGALAPNLLLAPRAHAADLDDDTLRGPLTVGPAAFTRWSGFYAGGQFNYSSGNTDFSKATQPLIANSGQNLALVTEAQIDQWTPLGSNANANATGWGGFVGYNTQWQDLIVGIEGNYTHAPFTTVATATPLDRVVSVGGNTDSVHETGSGSLSITDFGSVRARFGYVFNNFLPYGFAGLALGRGSYDVTADASGQQSTGSVPCTPAPGTCVDYDIGGTVSKSNTLLYGFAVGGGLDWAVTQNIFLRGEYEFIQFAPVANITATISSVRVGAGFKF